MHPACRAGGGTSIIRAMTCRSLRTGFLLPAAFLLAACFNPDDSTADTEGATGTGTGTSTGSDSTASTTEDSTTPGTSTGMGSTSAVDSTGAAAMCGDGSVDAGEDCDDGNTMAGDGCSSACLDETVFCDPGLVGARSTNQVGRMVADGGYLYVITPFVSNSYPQLRIFDVQDPESISMEGSFELDTNNAPNHHAVGIVKAGDHVLIGGQDPELISVDVSDPATPQLAFIQSPNESDGHLALSGSFLYAARSVSETVRVYEVSDPASPSIVGSIGDPGRVYHNVGVAGDHAYISAAPNHVDVIDVSVPAAGMLVGMYAHDTNWPSAVRRIVANDDTVAVAVGNGVQLLDASLPTAPESAAEIAQYAYDLAILDNFLYVPETDGLRVYDIANPSDPKVAASFVELDSDGFSVALGGPYVFLGNASGIRVLGGMPGLCDAVCGNDHVEYPEDCDDGNLDDGDGCSAGCIDE